VVVSPIGAGDHGKVAEFVADAWIPDAAAHTGGAAACEVKLANVARQDARSAVRPAAPGRPLHQYFGRSPREEQACSGFH
jgi:hypothetical protein